MMLEIKYRLHLVKAVITVFIFIANSLSASIDLNDLAQDYVLEQRRYEIPGYPTAFNPSIVRWRGELLMSFRCILDLKHKFHGRIGLVKLDEDFNIISVPQLLDTIYPGASFPARTDDGRLIVIGDRLWMVYSDCKDVLISKGGFRVFIAEITFDGTSYGVQNIECLCEYEGENKNVREKNWVPFDYNENLLLAYSLTPHKIFRPILGTETCETLATTYAMIDWEKQWGTLRGGTSALIDGDHYLAFSHSWIKMSSLQSKEKIIPHYFIGAYKFSKEPPFEITHISPEPIIGQGFYDGYVYKPLFGTVAVIYPGGYVADENYIWMACGKHDYECWMIKLDKRKIIDSLIPVF